MKSVLITVGVKHKCRCENSDIMTNTFFDLIERCNLHVRSTTQHRFYPNGITIVAILSESHIVISTYPDKYIVYIDFFSCQENCDEVIANFIAVVKCIFGHDVNVTIVPRNVGSVN